MALVGRFGHMPGHEEGQILRQPMLENTPTDFLAGGLPCVSQQIEFPPQTGVGCAADDIGRTFFRHAPDDPKCGRAHQA